MESFDTPMKEFYQIMQGKTERGQIFVLCLEQALKAIKQQHPHSMMEEDGIKHLKNHMFHGLKPNICNALCYMYDKPDLQYSQLVMAARKAETETPGSNVHEARAKSAVVETDSQSKVAKSDPSYEAITQYIAYIMSTITNQNTNKINVQNGPKWNNGDMKFSGAENPEVQEGQKGYEMFGMWKYGTWM